MAGSARNFKPSSLTRTPPEAPTDSKSFRQRETMSYPRQLEDPDQPDLELLVCAIGSTGDPVQRPAGTSRISSRMPTAFAPSFTFTDVGPAPGTMFIRTTTATLSHGLDLPGIPSRTARPRFVAPMGFSTIASSTTFLAMRAGIHRFSRRCSILSREQPPQRRFLCAKHPAWFDLRERTEPGCHSADPNLKNRPAKTGISVYTRVATNLATGSRLCGAHANSGIRSLDAVPPDPALVQQAIAACVAAGPLPMGVAIREPARKNQRRRALWRHPSNWRAGFGS